MKRGRSSWSGTGDGKNDASSVLSDYCRVVNELPDWAKEVLQSRMGTIFVEAKDSFEIHLKSLDDVVPKNDYEFFCREFTEIFETRGQAVLKRIDENRGLGRDFMITNDFFWREFEHLFIKRSPEVGVLGRKIQEMLKEAEKTGKLILERISTRLKGCGAAVYIYKLMRRLVKTKGGRSVVPIDPNLIYAT